MKKNQRKLRKLRHYDNVIIFPGTYERLVRDGERYLSKQQYEKAVQAFEGAIQLEPASNHFYFSYALALYETRDFQRAKEFALLALESGHNDHILVMELYLTVLIHLEEHEEVELSVGALIEEGLVPKNMLSKFIYLRDLNRRLSIRYKEEPASVEPPLTFESFKEKDLYFQQQFLTSLKGMELKQSIPLLEEIVESSVVPPSIITFSLMLLKEVAYDQFVTVQKYGQKIEILPKDIVLPGQDIYSQSILDEVGKMFEKDPSKLQFADGAIRKFVINAFPFNWGDYSVEEVANAYVQYIEHLVTGEAFSSDPLLEFIQIVDGEADF